MLAASDAYEAAARDPATPPAKLEKLQRAAAEAEARNGELAKARAAAAKAPPSYWLRSRCPSGR